MAITKEVNIVVKETGLDEVNKKVNKLETSVESLEDQQRSLAKSMGDSSQSVLDNGGAMGLLNDATGGLAMTVKDAVEASVLFTKSQKASAIGQSIYTTVVGTSTGAMKAFRIALASTGIGLLVIGLGYLVANFEKVSKWANSFGWIKKLGEWMGSLTEAVTDFIGVTSEAERALEKFDKASQKRSDELDRKLAENGSAYSESAKKKMAIDAKLEEDLRKHIYNEAALRKEAALAKEAIDKDNAEKIAKIEKDKQDKLNAIAKESSDKKKAAALKAKEDEKQRLADEAKTKLDADMQSAKDAMAIVDELQKNVETPAEKEQREFDEKKAVLEANNLSIEELEKQHKQNLFEISEEDRLKKEASNKEASDKEIAQAQAVADAKLAIQNGTLDTVSAGIGLLKSLGEKSKAVQKATLIAENAAGIAKTVINTVAANAKSVAASPLTAGQPWVTLNTVSAGIGIASSIAATAKGLSALGGGNAGGGANIGGGGQAPQAPSFNLVQGTGRNQIAEGLNRQAPIKAYVVPTDVSTGQSLDRNIIKSASL